MNQLVVIDEFFALLERSELLPHDEVTLLAERFSTSELSARDCAKQLVGEGILTRFQAERLLTGRYRGFFIDRYKLLAVLGSGGMGFVYIAEDLDTGKKVALKVLTDHHEVDSGMKTRLQIEAEAGMLLNHENIVKTNRIEDSGAKCFVEMEYVAGVNLHELIALAGPLKCSQACDLARQAAKGLHYAHRANFIHRDVKPANFLIDKTGQLKILDFGLALAKDRLDEEFSLAMIFGHECLGTADFIAPEQIIDSMKADERSDIYGLGCTFYSMLTGKVPFPYAATAQKLEAQKTEEPLPIQSFAPETPTEVIDILKKMMAKNPEDRFQSTTDVVRALKPWSKRKTLQFNMSDILTIRAKQASKKQKKRSAASTSDVTSGSAWTTSDMRLSGTTPSGTLSERGIETAMSRDTLHVLDDGKVLPSESEPLMVIPSESTATLAATVAEQFDAMPAEHRFVLVDLTKKSRVPIQTNRLLLGRNAACDLLLDFSGVSGRHCLLSFDGDQWHLQDLDSKNGTQIDGKPITSSVLPVGSRFTIARKYQFRIEDLEQPKRSLLLPVVGAVLAAGVAALLYWFFAGR